MVEERVKVKYRVKRKDVERAVNNVNRKKAIGLKPTKPKKLAKRKKFKKYVAKVSKNKASLELKKNSIKKSKKKLKEMETTESQSISNSVGVADRTVRTTKGVNKTRKLGVKGYKTIREHKEYKARKSKPKIKTKVRVKNAKQQKSVPSVKSNFRVKKSEVQKVNTKRIDTNTQRYVDKNTIKNVNTKTLDTSKNRKPLSYKKFKAKKMKITRNNYRDNYRNVKNATNSTYTNNVNFKDNVTVKAINNTRYTGSSNVDTYANRNMKEIIDIKKRKKYERSKKVSNLDTFYSDKSSKDVKSDKEYLTKKKTKVNEKSTNAKKVAKQEKIKPIANKNQYTKQLKKQSKIATKKTKQKAKKSATKISTKATQMVSKALTKVSAGVTKAVGSVIANPYVLIAIAIILAIILIISIMLPVSSVFENKPNANADTLIYLIQELSALDDEANEYLENISDEEGIECDEVRYLYNSPKESIYSSSKEFIIYLMLLDDNVITEDSIETLKMIHEKSYKVEMEVVYEIDEETEEEVKILNVTLTVYTFDEMLDILVFTQEQKDRAIEIQKLPFEKIYTEISFNEAGQGLTKEQIEEMVGELPSTTINRENLRGVAFTLVNYTVYDWGGKASGSVERPTGLDCSGFVAWVYDRAGITNSLQAGGTAYQWGVTSPISYGELKVGDLGFKDNPHTLANNGINHVGMYIGNGLWIECYSGHGVGVTSGNSFRYYRTVDGFND